MYNMYSNEIWNPSCVENINGMIAYFTHSKQVKKQANWAYEGLVTSLSSNQIMNPVIVAGTDLNWLEQF